MCLRPVVVSAIQATGRIEFEDGLRIGIQSEVRNSLQSTCTIHDVNLVGHRENVQDQGGGVSQDPPQADQLLIYFRIELVKEV